MSFDDWMLAPHVLSAFSYVAGLVLFGVLIVAVRKTDTRADAQLRPVHQGGQRRGRYRSAARSSSGSSRRSRSGLRHLGSLDRRRARPLVRCRWVNSVRARPTSFPQKAQELTAAGKRGRSSELLAPNRTSSGLMLQFLASLVLVLIPADMIWKPGA